MQDSDIMQLFTYQSNYEVNGVTLEKMVYFDFYNGERVWYLSNPEGKKVCMLTSASKIYIEKELASFDTLDESK